MGVRLAAEGALSQEQGAVDPLPPPPLPLTPPPPQPLSQTLSLSLVRSLALSQH